MPGAAVRLVLGTADTTCLWERNTTLLALSLLPPTPAELPQVEITKAYFAKQADEITLQQADVVLVLQEEDGECGWATPRWASTRQGCRVCLRYSDQR